MKSTTAATILAMASGSVAGLLPSVEPTWIQGNKFGKRQTSSCPDGMLEIQIESEVDTWYYQFDGRIWGSQSGQGGSIGGFCVPANSAGGAVYIGPTANPNAGNTKLECQFNGDGTGNCDVSLVDGYSLSMTCTELQGATSSSKTIGGGVDLYAQNSCPDQQGSFCKNDNGYGPEASVAEFFQPAVQNGNAYCIWVNCSEDYQYNTSEGFSCTIDNTSNPAE